MPTISDNPVEIHPRIIDALSPWSHFYHVLWPIIIDHAHWSTRRFTLRNVNQRFRKLASLHERSDRAKRWQARVLGETYREIPYPFLPLNLPDSAEWRVWSGKNVAFRGLEAFRQFCELGDVNADDYTVYDDMPSEHEELRSASPRFGGRYDFNHYIWRSRTGNLILETSEDPFKSTGGDGHHYHHCHYIGLAGPAERMIAMYDFIHDNDPSYQADSTKAVTRWGEMAWDRCYI